MIKVPYLLVNLVASQVEMNDNTDTNAHTHNESAPPDGNLPRHVAKYKQFNKLMLTANRANNT